MYKEFPLPSIQIPQVRKVFLTQKVEMLYFVMEREYTLLQWPSAFPFFFIKRNKIHFLVSNLETLNNVELVYKPWETK